MHGIPHAFACVAALLAALAVADAAHGAAPASPRTIVTDMAFIRPARLGTSRERLQPVLERLAHEACIGRDQEIVSLTRTGEEVYARLLEQRTKGLDRLLQGWPQDQKAQMADAVRRLADRLLSDDFDSDLSASRRQLRAMSGQS